MPQLKEEFSKGIDGSWPRRPTVRVAAEDGSHGAAMSEEALHHHAHVLLWSHEHLQIGNPHQSTLEK